MQEFELSKLSEGTSYVIKTDLTGVVTWWVRMARHPDTNIKKKIKTAYHISPNSTFPKAR